MFFELSLRVALFGILHRAVETVSPVTLYCDTWRSPIPSLTAAMNGFDPMVSDPFTFPNPGFKHTIFNPLKREPDGRNTLHSFVDRIEETVYCNRHLHGSSVKSYNTYKTRRQSDFSFTKGSEKSTTYDQTVEGEVNILGIFKIGTKKRFYFDKSSGNGRSETKQEESIKKFFTELGGEIVEVNAECVTHSVSIASYSEPVFTDAFTEAVKKLHIAALDPNSKNSNETFVQFITDYGTHYMKTTKLGSKIYFQKLFAYSSRTAEEEFSRKKCIENSVRSSFSVPVIVDITNSFQQTSSSCDHSNNVQNSNSGLDYNTENILSIGSLPTGDIETWAEKAMDSPVPIGFTLDKISNLMKPEWINDIMVSDTDSELGYLDGTQISKFLESKTVEYCLLLFGKNCLTPLKGCGYNSNCPAENICVHDTSSVLGYKCATDWITIIAGGWETYGPTSVVQVFTTRDMRSDLPNITVPVSLSSLAVYNNKVRICGGYISSTNSSDKCYEMNPLAKSPSWKKIADLPTGLSGHSIIQVFDEIWVLHSSTVYVVPAAGPQVRYSLSIGSLPSYSCVLSDGVTSFIIPNNQKDVYSNSNADSPGSWIKVASLSEALSDRGCLWMGSEIYVTGGRRGNDICTTVVEVIDVPSLTVRKGGNLHMPRRDHAMGIIDGVPAVIGGYDCTNLYNTIEKFDKASNTWKPTSLTTNAGKVSRMAYATFAV